MASGIVIFFRNLVFITALITSGTIYAQKFSYNENKLGGNFQLIFYNLEKNKADVIAEEAYQLVDSLNLILSNYLEGSEINLFNKEGHLNNASIQLVEVLKYAQLAYQKTNGYFDISIQPLIDLWNKAAEKQKLPSNKYLEKQRCKIGLEKVLTVDLNNQFILQKKSNLELGGIAKGYIIDQVYNFLAALNISSFLIEAAGDIRVFGKPTGSNYWTIGVSSNRDNNFQVNLKSGQAIATSGKTYRYRTIEGEKFSHIINPKTLTPITHNFTTSVIANDATTADYLASTFNILTDKNEIKSILNNHNNIEILMFNNRGTFFETDHFLIK